MDIKDIRELMEMSTEDMKKIEMNKNTVVALNGVPVNLVDEMKGLSDKERIAMEHQLFSALAVPAGEFKTEKWNMPTDWTPTQFEEERIKEYPLSAYSTTELKKELRRRKGK